MRPRISKFSWAIFALNVLGVVVLTWNVDPATPAGVARIVASGFAALAAILTLVNGAKLGARVSALERGRYPRLRDGAAQRITRRILGETAQTVTIAGEGGDDIREVASTLREALIAARWHLRDMNLGGTLWDGGTGILVYHTAVSTPAATALISALQAEGLAVTDAGGSTTGYPVHIAFRRP
jgi:hypothetical protein